MWLLLCRMIGHCFWLSDSSIRLGVPHQELEDILQTLIEKEEFNCLKSVRQIEQRLSFNFN
ncbi:hypothetical protein Pla110_33650 [Polystyrenella longa]|uniref:Uncharacterized protein n=1 Tax=Polystyrenella longa TaxID=2528007 RepID=A0A518CQW7_9PLAN|nr:hypothetical protein Pla110_33650 [Polystyrenella longa]